MFDPQCTENLSDAYRAFWIHCTNGSGETVSLQAARIGGWAVARCAAADVPAADLHQMCPEFVWGVMKEDLAAHGAGTRMGYTVQEPKLLQWAEQPEGASRQVAFICCDTVDLAYLAELESHPV